MTKLDVKKAKEANSIGENLLKKLAPTLSKSQFLISKTSLNKGKFPEKWKTSVNAPLHQEGDKAAIMFYRPINCLSFPSKVLEKIVFDCLHNAIRKFLHDSQFDFRQLPSCIDRIICFLDKIYRDNDTKLPEELTVFY
ncbi:uncharacterized protein LOC142354563 [Convolutriloba macropyga]|uniref:uncharacterized protein LOC142354563 n=1 Tax=Convolutriloba macropyga TaxID=536237 RepID=UPI003F51DDD3